MPQETWTTLKLLTWTKAYLSSKGIANARLEAEWLLCSATGLDRVGLYLNYDKPISGGELSEFRSMITRRSKREPLQHILGTQEFFGLNFMVSADVLIPRHDTETLVDELVANSSGVRSILDIGTGSGCIAIALAHKLPSVAVTATDISTAALSIAQRNARLHSVTIEFIAGSLFSGLAGRHFDVIVSNPPYIPTLDIVTLEPEVRDYDPRLALDGGSDGMDFYRTLIAEAPAFLNDGGWLFVEAGIGQSADIKKLYRFANVFKEPCTTCDTQGIERVVRAQKKEQL